MAEVRLVAQERTDFGKGGARRTRRAGQVPAVLYGHGQPPRHLSLPTQEAWLALRGGANTLLTLVLPGGNQLALPKAVQAHPIRGDLQHIDLIIVRRGEKVTVEVPVTVVGEPGPDGMLNYDYTSLSIEAEATNIPQSLEVNVEGMEVGTHVTAGEVRLPANTALVTDSEALVVGIVQAPTQAEMEAETAEAEAEAGVVQDAPSAEAAGEAAEESDDSSGG